MGMCCHHLYLFYLPNQDHIKLGKSITKKMSVDAILLWWIIAQCLQIFRPNKVADCGCFSTFNVAKFSPSLFTLAVSRFVLRLTSALTRFRCLLFMILDQTRPYSLFHISSRIKITRFCVTITLPLWVWPTKRVFAILRKRLAKVPKTGQNFIYTEHNLKCCCVCEQTTRKGLWTDRTECSTCGHWHLRAYTNTHTYTHKLYTLCVVDDHWHINVFANLAHTHKHSNIHSPKLVSSNPRSSAQF